MGKTEKDLQETLKKVNDEGKQYGMKMNIKTTIAMMTSWSKEVAIINLKIKGTVAGQVDKLAYLDHQLDKSGRCDEEIRKRIAIARSAY